MAANEIKFELQTSTRFAVAWIWLVALLHRTRLSRLIGSDRVNGWAINGCYRLCFYRIRFRGRWGKWQRAYRTTPDGFHEQVMP